MQQEQQAASGVLMSWINRAAVNVGALLALVAGALNVPDLFSWMLMMVGS